MTLTVCLHQREISIGGLRRLETTTELRDDERNGILGSSAERLLPRLAGLSSRA